jgi:polysaccharide pyruvyl transferase WcaK-like protein
MACATACPRSAIKIRQDALVIGSDEVFNCTQAGAEVGYSPQLFGKDHCADRLISYAASFGSTTMEKLQQYGIRQEIADCLRGFDSLSVRDENSAHIVSELCGKEPAQNIDPVLLYDFPEVDNIKVELDNYIIVYAYAGRIRDDEAKVIREFAKKTGKQLVSLGFRQAFCDRCIQASPLEVLAYVKHADYVITDTFHGTVFSIKYQVPFATLIRSSNQQKLGDLLHRFGLGSRSVEQLDTLETIVTNPMNEDEVRSLLRAYQESARKYLGSALL